MKQSLMLKAFLLLSIISQTLCFAKPIQHNLGHFHTSFERLNKKLRVQSFDEDPLFWIGGTTPIAIYNPVNYVSEKGNVYGVKGSLNMLLSNKMVLRFGISILNEKGSVKGYGNNQTLADISQKESFSFQTAQVGYDVSQSENLHFIISTGLSFHEMDLRGQYDQFHEAVNSAPYSGSLFGAPIWIPGSQISPAYHSYNMEHKNSFGIPVSITIIPRIGRYLAPDISLMLDINGDRSMCFFSFGWDIGKVFEAK